MLITFRWTAPATPELRYSGLTHAERLPRPTTLAIDGRHCSALTIDTDPDIVGWATRMEDAIVVLGLPRDRVEHLTLELASTERNSPA